MTSTCLRPRREPNFTVPSAVAKSVSSPPRPTFWPGKNLVPRWRTIIEPEVTAEPSNTFTPRRWAAESAVASGASTLGLGHDELSSGSAGRDGRDLDRRVVLTVAPTALLVGLVLEDHGIDLRALLLADHLGGDGGALELVGGGQHRLAVDHH